VLVLTLSGCAPKPGELLSRSYIGGAAEAESLNPRRYMPDALMRVAPYRGGHPRATRRQTCVDPRNDHKLRVELPWPDAGYVVVDLPEVLFAGRSRLFMAHTNARDPGTRRFAALPNVRWKRYRDGRMNYYRELPGGVAFSALAIPQRGYVDLAFSVINHSKVDLSGVRAQVCVLLKGAPGFSARTRDNAYCVVRDRLVPVSTAVRRESGSGRYGLRFSGRRRHADAPLAAVRSEDGRRWIVTVWEPCFALPVNSANPCIHSDPKLGDCPRGEQVTVRGRLYFVEGNVDEFYKALSARAEGFLPQLEESQ